MLPPGHYSCILITHTSAHTRTHNAHTHAHTHRHTYTCTHVQTYTQTHTHSQTPNHTDIHTYIIFPLQYQTRCDASRLTPHASRLSHAAGDEIIVEEFLDGEEASFFALVNGEESVSMATVQVRFRAAQNGKERRVCLWRQSRWASVRLKMGRNRRVCAWRQLRCASVRLKMGRNRRVCVATAQVRFRAAQNGKEQKSVCVATVQVCLCIGLTRTIYVRGLYVIFGRQIPK